jgi:septum formation protein
VIPLTAVDLVLASTSRYRGELLTRIAPGFRRLAPEVDETARPGESPSQRARRLARAKAEAVLRRCPGAVVIGSDQVAELDGSVLDKPGDLAKAAHQLAVSSGREVRFHTALCLSDGRHGPARHHEALDLTRVQFRKLDAAEIARYLEREQPLDCAGSFRAEGLGIALFERIESEDPTALIGLPLIALSRLLRQAGIAVL